MSTDWKLLYRKNVFASKWVNVEEWNMQLPQGKEQSFFINIEHDIVIVFGITPDKEILVIEQYYISLQRTSLALVAGFVEGSDTPLHTAQKELKEETGFEAEKFISLGSTIKGKYLTGQIHFFLAENVRKTSEQQLEDSEDIQIKVMPLDVFKQAVHNGGLSEGFMELAAYRALNYLNLN